MPRSRERRAQWLREEADAALDAGRLDVASFLLRRATHHLAPARPPAPPLGQVRRAG